MANVSESARKTRALKVRLHPAVYAKLEALAANEGLTMGDWIAVQVETRRKPRLDRRQVTKLLAENRRAAAGLHG